MQEVGLDGGGIKLVKGAPGVPSQRRHAGQVGLPGALGKAPQDHGVVHPLPEFGHVVLLVNLGTFPNHKIEQLAWLR